ncbi:hypothetical protein K8R78_06040 [bacterium]|nr:hypothetical protein [bacterium]
MKPLLLISTLLLLLVLPTVGEVIDTTETSNGNAVDSEWVEVTEETGEEPAEIAEPVAIPAPWKPEPTEALWRSGVLAGWGQFYNDEWLKGVLMLGVEVATVYGIVYHADQAAIEKRLAESYANNSDQYEIDSNSSQASEHQQNFNDHRIAYETHIWLTALVLVYSMLDAYVDAHLYDFEVGEELDKETVSYSLSPRLLPDSGGDLSVGLEFSLTF